MRPPLADASSEHELTDGAVARFASGHGSRRPAGEHGGALVSAMAEAALNAVPPRDPSPPSRSGVPVRTREPGRCGGGV